MYVFEIVINHQQNDYEGLEHDIFDYLTSLERNGQILPRQHHLPYTDNGITKATVVCPMLDALDVKYMNLYAKSSHDKIVKATGATIHTNHVGYDYDYPILNFTPPTSSDFYVLRYGWSSPLVDGITHQGTPLFMIPATDAEGTSFDNIWSWYREAEFLYRLWLGSKLVTEDFALIQMQDVNSEHSKLGRKLCQIIEEKTGIPTYYFLNNYRDWTPAEDLFQKCPVTGEEWLITPKISDYIDFKCDNSRLVSELSQNCTDTNELNV